MMTYCENCGKIIDLGKKKCDYCTKADTVKDRDEEYKRQLKLQWRIK